MIMKFSANRTKVTAVIVFLIFILVLGSIVPFIFMKQGSLKYVLVGFLIVGFIRFIQLAIADYKMSVVVNDIGLESVRNETIIMVDWNNVYSLEYKGSKVIPISECMIIHTSKGNVYVDYNFQEYLEAWNIIARQSKINNSNILIDERIVKRISGLLG